MAKSDTILGRCRNREAYKEAWRSGKFFTVSAYRRRWRNGKNWRINGPIRFSDPVTAKTISTPAVVYRIRVWPKDWEL